MKKILACCLISLLLSSCVSVVSNAASLSTQKKSNVALICISQTYHYIDAYLVFGTLGEGINYQFSRTYLTNNNTKKRYYLGNLYRSSLCFYANQGSYTLDIDSPGQNPPFISKTEAFMAGNHYFYALQSNDTEHQILFKRISSEQGKSYLQKMPPKSILRLESYTAPDSIHIHTTYKIINGTSHILAISEAVESQQNHFTQLTPGQSYPYSIINTIFKDNPHFNTNFLMLNPEKPNETPSQLYLSGYAPGFSENTSEKSILITADTYEAPGMHFWASSLRSKTNCHSNITSSDVYIRCSVLMHDVENASIRNESIFTKMDSLTTVGGARD